MRYSSFVAIAGLASATVWAQGQTYSPPIEIDNGSIPPVHDDPLLDLLTAHRLEPFADASAYRAWLNWVQSYNNDRSRRAEEARRRKLKPKTGFLKIAQETQTEEICTDPECLYPDANAEVVVTGSRVSGARSNAAPARASKSAPSSAPNITNVQTSGVDEGDVVKQIGDYLAVLQDGRIFVVDIRDKRLRLVDRMNVYSSTRDWSWYDEMLVEGDRIIVTAYSYGRQATEISVFRLDQAGGKLSREGRFFLTSYDYYSGDNYASRIVGDKLVLYTLYDARLILNDGNGPRLWRWRDEGERGGEAGLPAEQRREGRALIDARAIHRPVLRTNNPMIHVITVCPLKSYAAGDVPACRVSAFAGPGAREFFVSPTDVFLWVGQGGWPWYYNGGEPQQCQRGKTAYGSVAPAAVYRIPIDGGAPGAVGLRGQPIDQFSMDMTKDNFRILTRWSSPGCDANAPNPTLAYANIPLNEFATRFRSIAPARHIDVPAPPTGVIENRFADDWLVYGGRQSGYGAVPDQARPAGSPVFVLPVEQPRGVQQLSLPHNIIRIERVGSDRMALGGYRNTQGLDLSLLQLGGKARRLDTLTLKGRFESEGRSHAFNSNVDESGRGLLGIPTVLRRGRAMRYVWNSEGSDVSFLGVTPNGRLSDAGALEQGLKRPDASYRCEVSCIDWYGNSRPIFTNGRIFALMATEIAEGRIGQDGIVEIDRLNLTRRIGKRPALPGD